MKTFQLKIKRKFCQTCDVSWPTYLLVVLFGLGSWVAVNGVWVELPVLVQEAPEGWKLPSIFAVAIQIANIGPVLYTILNAAFPGKFKDTIVIYVILFIGILACGLMGFFWKETVFISSIGQTHSVALIALVFAVAFVDCTSSVTFLPYMADYRKEYMSALFVGGGLSALLPSLLAIAQGISNSNDPCANFTSSNATYSTDSSDLHFGTNVFFFGLMLLMVVSLLAFVGLNKFSFVKREKMNDLFRNDDTIPREALALDSSQEFELQSANGNGQFTADDGSETTTCHRVNYPGQLKYLLVIQVWIHAFSNGVIPSIQPFACIPYGNHIYYLTLILSNIVNPLASLVFYWLPTTKILFISLLSAIYTSLVAYILLVASLSSNPPLANNAIGASIIVIINVTSVAIVTYTKVGISTWMQKQGEKQLRWAGIALQLGSFLGASAIFPFVNIFDSFSPC